MNIGTVKWFSLEKGYGFIHPDDGRPNIFVRLSAVERAGLSGLKEGQRIIFEIEQDERGPTAVSLQALVFAPTPRLDDPFATTKYVPHLFRLGLICILAAAPPADIERGRPPRAASGRACHEPAFAVAVALARPAHGAQLTNPAA